MHTKCFLIVERSLECTQYIPSPYFSFCSVKVKKLKAEKLIQTQYPNVMYNTPICMPLLKTNALMYFVFHGYELP